MIRSYHMTLLGLAVLCLCGCHKAAAPTVADALPVIAARDSLRVLVERYWDETQSSNPWSAWGLRRRADGETPDDTLDTQGLADALAIERRYLGELLGMPRAQLDAGSKATFDMFRREREAAIEGFTFPAELMPIDPYDGFPLRFAVAAQAAEGVALSGGPGLDRWQALVAQYAHWNAQAIANLREGVRRGYTLPLAEVERVLPMLAALGNDTESNAFYLGLKAPAGAGESAAAPALRNSIQNTLLPAFRSLHDYLLREYLTRARTSIGWSALPMGDAWYAYIVRRTVGMQTARELQAQAAAELPRLHARLQALLGESGFSGNAQEFLEASRHDPRFVFGNPQELSTAYADVKTRVRAALPTLFASPPDIEIDIRAADDYLQNTGDTTFYNAAGDHEHPALMFFNPGQLDGLAAMGVAAQYLQKAEPGRLYQLALQGGRANLPRFRRYGDVTAFSQGWALYASSLGDELSIYRDPQEKFAALFKQLSCATGVAVDVGIHSQKWNRKQALDYVHAQLPAADVLAANLVDRVIARPGAALACSVGFAKIQALRAHAEQALASRFDAREFHSQVLNEGAVTLDILDSNIRQWIDAKLAAPPKVD